MKKRQRRTKQRPHSRRISSHDYPQPPKGLIDRMYDAIEDPYTYKSSTVLVNKLDLQSQAELDAFEAEISSARAEEPLPDGSMAFEH
jgi:hypothetical protein